MFTGSDEEVVPHVVFRLWQGIRVATVVARKDGRFMADNFENKRDRSMFHSCDRWFFVDLLAE